MRVVLAGASYPEKYFEIPTLWQSKYRSAVCVRVFAKENQEVRQGL